MESPAQGVPRPTDPIRREMTDSTIILLRRAREGDERARSALFERCAPCVARWAHGRMPGRLRGAQETADLVQDVLVGFLSRPDPYQLRNDGAFLAYLRMAVWRRLQSLLRTPAAKAEHLRLDHEESPELPATDPSPIEQRVGAETVERYEAALAGLDERERTAVILRIDLRLSIAEIAEAMGFPSWDAARKFANRAVIKLTEKM
jgi:RNA polymerase sigma factor (sigma-70 family)